MGETPDELLWKLAFQRGVLTLLQERDHRDPMIQKALEQLDGLITQLA